jgi:putative addiction module component (TIGR02574 family)
MEMRSMVLFPRFFIHGTDNSKKSADFRHCGYLIMEVCNHCTRSAPACTGTSAAKRMKCEKPVHKHDDCLLLQIFARRETCPARSGFFLSYKNMDRDWESIRNGALALEPSRQALLVEEIVDQLAHTPHMQAWLDESERRLEAYHRGEIKAVDMEDSLRRIERLISK